MLTEPSRPSPAEVAAELDGHIAALAGEGATARPEQLAAVEAVVAGRQRTLLVARTGFGKSAVYFSATRMLRDRGWGPTVVVSPLLALMRDQVDAARKLGLSAETINSSNLDAWGSIEAKIEADEVDLLLIAPERLANAGFRSRVFDTMRTRAFALVCDEAHCISDWGHDFRPDYRRLRRLLDELPAWTPVLATTATANQRVTDDVAAQLGDDTLVLRTSLDRVSLHLGVVELPDDAHRLAWLADKMNTLDGSGIIYCLTVDQAETTAAWLRSRDHAVEAYSGGVDPERRLLLERQLRNNEIKALVATSALGMGFDKGDMAFCVHLGLPPSPVAYYQQIGRAGRNIDRAEVIALPRPTEDAAVWRWFESVSMPSEAICRSVLDELEQFGSSSVAALEKNVNLGRTRLNTLLNILDVDGAVERVKGGWARTSEDWNYDHTLVDTLKQMRRDEGEQMRDWAALTGCRLRYLREALDDAEATDCGRCDNCTGNRLDPAVDPAEVAAAGQRLRGGDVVIDARKQWPTGFGAPKGKIKKEAQHHEGRALARVGDGGWNPMIEELVRAADRGEAAVLSPELVPALAAVLKRWPWAERPTWICPMPSRRRDDLIGAVAAGLGSLGKLPVFPALIDSAVIDRSHDAGFQAEQSNSAHQVRNLWGRLSVDENQLPDADVRSGPVLLIDDEVDSRWTLAIATSVLAEAGLGPVLPLALRSR